MNAQAGMCYQPKQCESFHDGHEHTYVHTIYALHQQNLSDCEGDWPAALTLPLIERLMRAFKTHRAAVDFDAGFVKSFVSSVIS